MVEIGVNASSLSCCSFFRCLPERDNLTLSFFVLWPIVRSHSVIEVVVVAVVY